MNVTKTKGPVALDKLAQQIEETYPRPPMNFPETRPTDFAPPATRRAVAAEETTLEQIHSLTKEFDDIVAAAENDMAALKEDARNVRDEYVRHTTRVISDIKRLQEGVKLSMQTMRSLREQCDKLDASSAMLGPGTDS